MRAIRIYGRLALTLGLLFMVAALPVYADATKAERVTKLSNALWLNDTAQARSVIASGAIGDSGPEGMCWLHAAILHGMPELLEPLVQAGVPIECQHTGETPLQYAVIHNNYLATKELVRMGADVNRRKPGGSGFSSYYPLNYAVQTFMRKKLNGGSSSRAKKIIRLLLDNDANPNLLNEPGDASKLCILAEQGATDVVEMLVKAGAKPNLVSDTDNTEGVTALECALLRKKSNLQTVQALLNAGADPTAGPHADELLDKARQNMPQAVPLLKQYGAR